MIKGERKDNTVRDPPDRAHGPGFLIPFVTNCSTQQYILHDKSNA